MRTTKKKLRGVAIQGQYQSPTQPRDYTMEIAQSSLCGWDYMIRTTKSTRLRYTVEATYAIKATRWSLHAGDSIKPIKPAAGPFEFLSAPCCQLCTMYKPLPTTNPLSTTSLANYEHKWLVTICQVGLQLLSTHFPQRPFVINVNYMLVVARALERRQQQRL